jgi:hypothetical protein
MLAGVRMARVVAADTRIGDEVWVDNGWWRVVGKSEKDGTVEIDCAGRPDPHTVGRRDPVLIRWAVPDSTTALARDQRRDA